MNIESASLSPLAPSSGTVERASPPVTDGGVVTEGFSGTLVAHIELLSAIKTGDTLPIQVSDLAGLQGVNGSPVVAGVPAATVDTQNFAALLGNDLPSSYKTKDDVDHEAALVAVTDALKYIAMGTTAGEKAAEAEQNMKDVIAMAVPAEQNMKDVIAMAVPAEQSMKDVIAMTVPAEQSMKDVIAMTVPAEQSMKDVIATTVPAEQNMKDVVAMTVPPEQSTTDVAAEAEQSMTGAVVVDAPIQMDLGQTKGKPDKKQVEGEAQIAVVDDNLGTEELSAAIILPAIMSVEQGKAVNNLAPDAIKENVLLSFIKPSTADAKPNQSAKASDDGLQSEAIVGQSVQDKQSFNIKYVENVGQTEKTGRVEQQVLSLEGEKTLPRVGADTAPLNRSVVDNKTDVPAITKPLSHPEWNKDLGERIVWMSSKAIPTAEIRLNPQHLGPISVRVDVADDQATVVFTAQHAATREAIEASIPKLREMMSAQQLNLVDVNVSQDSASDRGRSQAQNFAQTADGRGQGVVANGVDDVEQEIESGRAVVSKGLLSIYA